jgi:hypothetical protein
VSRLVSVPDPVIRLRAGPFVSNGGSAVVELLHGSAGMARTHMVARLASHVRDRRQRPGSCVLLVTTGAGMW